MSLPAVFSGRFYDEHLASEFYNGAHLTLLDELTRSNFDSTVFSVIDFPTPRQTKRYSTSRYFQEEDDTLRNIGFLLDVSFIRLVPFVFKNFFLNDYEFRISRWLSKSDAHTAVGNEIHRRIFQRMVKNIETGGSNLAPQYYFLHLLYPHSPFTHDEECKFIGRVQPLEITQAQIEQNCAIAEFAKFIQRLKDLDVYNKTLIILHGDTGSIIPVPTLAGIDEMVEKGRSFPVLAFKPINAEGDMIISDKPASLTDIPKTILSQLNIETVLGGMDLFQNVPNTRERQFMDFVVLNDALNPVSWRKDGVEN